MVDRVIVKVRGDDRGMGIICRVLHRSKGVNFLAVRQDDDAAWVLPGSAAHADAALTQALDFAAALGLPALLEIFKHIAVSGFFR